MSAADEAYDRLHGVDGHIQSVTPRYTPDRQPRPCPTCGRSGSCAECCCASPDHRRAWPQRPAKCSLCNHATSESPPARAQGAVNRTLDNLKEVLAFWQVRHVESGATVYCRNRLEAEAHVHESVSGPWVAEPATLPATNRVGEGRMVCEHTWDYSNTPGVDICTICGELRDWPKGAD